MDIKQRRSLVDNRINDEIKYRHCCEKNYLNATVQEREDFNSEEFYTSVGSREILAIFKAGEKNTPLDRAFDIYMPKGIVTGVYPLNSPDQLIEIAFTENFPAYLSYWAFEGVMDLTVQADQQEYFGKIDVKFKDKQGVEFTSNGEFAFSLKN